MKKQFAKAKKLLNIKEKNNEKEATKNPSRNSQARNKYDYFASKAKKEGYEQIAAIFAETALNEKEHAKMWFKELEGIGSTLENLMAAADGEHEEWTSMYKRFALEAREEGFDRIAFLFESVANVEKEHEARYNKLTKLLETGTIFARGKEIYWQCRNCGAVYKLAEAPEVCPTCGHPRSYFQKKEEI